MLASAGSPPYPTATRASWSRALVALGRRPGGAAARACCGRALASRAGSGSCGAARGRRLAARALPPDDPVRRRLFCGAEAVFLVVFVADGAARRLRARRLEHREADGHGVHERRERLATRSRRTTRGWRARTSTTTTSATSRWRWDPGRSASRRTTATTSSLALLFGLTAAAVFTLAGTLWAAARERLPPSRGGPVGAGPRGGRRSASCSATSRARGDGSTPADPPGDYDWFAPSRVIPDTINEFPWFSFLLGDLHAHVLALPFTLLALGLRAAGRARRAARRSPCWRGVAEALARRARDRRAVRDQLVVVPRRRRACSCSAVVTWLRAPESGGRRGYAVVWLVLVLVASVVLVLPFLLDSTRRRAASAGSSERAVVRALRRRQALLYGLVRGAARRPRTRRGCSPRAGRCARPCGASSRALFALLAARAAPTWRGRGALVALLAVAARRAALDRGSAPPSASCGCSSCGGRHLPADPELVYVRDEFDGSDLYRMNTVFKLGYQAWLLLAIAAACALPWAGAWLPRRALAGVGGGHRRAAAARRRLPVRGHLRAQGRLRALTDARRAAAGCAQRARRPGAIDWLRANTPGAAVVLEAVGDDYSAFGHGRISTFTGPPDRARLGRPRGAVGPRRRRSREADVRALYTTTDLRRGARADRQLRRRLRRLRPDRADDLRRRRAWTSGTSSDRACSTATARPSGSLRTLAHVEPLGHAAGRVPRLALRDASASRAPGRSLP